MEQATVALPRDWEMLAAWLRAEWQDTDQDAHPYHRGIYGAYAAIARIMKDGPPETREDRLYRFLAEALTSASETED